MLEALSTPYAAHQLEELRRVAYVARTWADGRCNGRTIGALRALEPHTAWFKEILELRALCYEQVRMAELAERARKELKEFEENERATPETQASLR
jgi:hypothetical protein